MGQGVGVVGQGLLGQLDLREADHWMRPVALWPGQASWPARATNSRLLWYLPRRHGYPPGSDLTPQPSIVWGARRNRGPSLG
jgi:hypothetical protein